MFARIDIVPARPGTRPAARRPSFRLPALALAVVLGGGLGGGLSSPARAQQDLSDQRLEQAGLAGQAHGDWDVTLGIGAAERPRYEGSDRYHVQPIPMAVITYRDQISIGPEGLAWNVLRWHGLRFGPVLGFMEGRDESDDGRLNGLGDIATAMTAGVFASYDVGPFRLGGTVRQAVTHSHNGMLGRVDLVYRQPFLPSRRLVLAAGPGVDFADASYNRTYFGITTSQSATSGLPVHSPGAGIKDVSLNMALTYWMTDHILVRGFASLKRLVGDDADSPIVEDKMQTVMGIGAAYHF